MSLPSLPAPPGFARYKRRAQKKTRSPEQTGVVALNAWGKLQALRPHLRTLLRDLPVMIRITRAWANGDYRRVPIKAIVSVVAALLYFLNPIDLIPDFIPFIGYLDDVAVMAYVMKKVHSEVERFENWEAAS